MVYVFSSIFFSSRRRHTRYWRDWSSDVCSSDLRAVVLTGAGHKAFCAGADIKEFPSVRDRVVEKKLARENEAFGAIESLSKPVVAAIEGLAFGGGCEVADRKSVA